MQLSKPSTCGRIQHRFQRIVLNVAFVKFEFYLGSHLKFIQQETMHIHIQPHIWTYVDFNSDRKSVV